MADPIRIVFEFHDVLESAESVAATFSDAAVDALEFDCAQSADHGKVAVVALCPDSQSVHRLADIAQETLAKLHETAVLAGIHVFGRPDAEVIQALFERWAGKAESPRPTDAGGEQPVEYRGFRIRPRLYRAPAGNSWLAGEFYIESGEEGATESLRFARTSRFCKTHDEAWQVTVASAKEAIDGGELVF